jgi:Novel toxin 15
MAVKSAEPRRNPAPDRQPAPVATASRSMVAAPQVNPARALQQRLGNIGMQAALRQRSTAGPSAGPAAATDSRAPAAADSPRAQATPPQAASQAAATPAASPAATSAAPASAATAPAAAIPAIAGAATAANAPAAAQAGAAAAQAAPAAPAVAAEAQADPAVAAAQSEALLAPAKTAIRSRAATQSHHPHANTIVGSAEAAAVHPDTAARGAAAHAAVAAVAAVDPGKLEAEHFKQALRQKVQAAMKSDSEADSESALKTETAEAVGSSVRGELNQQRQTASGPMAQAAATPPQPGQFPQPPAPDMQPPEAGAAPAPVAAPIPPAIPPAQLDTSADRNEVDAKLAQGHLTPAQLAKSSDPTVSGIAADREAAVEHSAASAAEARAADAHSQAAVHAEAGAAIGQGLTAMSHARGGSMGHASAGQLATRQRNEQKRQEITAKLNSIQQRASADIDGVLADMEKTAASLFDAGLKRAIDAFEAERAKLEEKARRERSAEWSKWAGGIGALIGYFASLDKEVVEQAIASARNAFDRVIEETIDAVATYVGLKLAAAKTRAAQGRAEADAEVASLPADLQGIGREARTQVEGAFQKLDETIDTRRDALVDKLSQSYSQARGDMEARAQAFRDDNKSWWDRVKEAVAGFIQAVLKFRDMLFSILAKAAAVVDAILDDPIGFLGNLVDGVKLGLQNFVGNILTHLKAGLMSWLFGTLASAGIQMPSSFGIKEIIGLILQIVGLTYANIRARAVRLLGEPMVANLEKAAEMFKVLITEGPAGLWRMLLEKLDALRERVLTEITEMLTVEVFKAGVVWLIGLLNPASAFIKACKAIYDIVMFFIERGRQIIELVNAILDSLAAIASGNLAKMAASIEGALAKMIPVAIGFLASLLGLDSISEKVKEIIEKIQEPVNQAIDWLIGKAVTLVKGAGQAITGMFGKKDKDDKQPETNDPLHDAKVKAGLAEIVQEDHAQSHDGRISHESAEQIAAKVKSRHPVFKVLRVKDAGDRWNYIYQASPEGEVTGEKKTEEETPQFENPVTVEFKCYTGKYDLGEYQGQLDGQAAGMNKQMVQKFKERRENYDNVKRPPDAKRLQAEFREARRLEKVDEYMKADKKLGYDEAVVKVDAFMKTQAALHEADLVAGGDVKPTALGSRYINSSIGSQWRTRIHTVDEFVDNHVKKHNLTKAQAEHVRMNVVLKANPIEGDGE